MGACCSTKNKYDTATVAPASHDDDDEAYLDSINGCSLGPVGRLDSTPHHDRVQELIDASEDSKTSKGSDRGGIGGKSPHKSRKGLKGDRGKALLDSGGSLAQKSASRLHKEKSRHKASKKSLTGKSRKKVKADIQVEELDSDSAILQRERSHSYSGRKNEDATSEVTRSRKSKSFREPKQVVHMLDKTVDDERVSQLLGGSTRAGEEDAQRGVARRLSKAQSVDLPQEDMLDNGVQSRTRVRDKPSRRDNTEIKAELDKLKALRVMKAMGAGAGQTNERLAASKWKTSKLVRKQENTEQVPLYAGKAVDGAVVRSSKSTRNVELQGGLKERRRSRKLLSELADALDVESDVLSKKSSNNAGNSRNKLMEMSMGEVETSPPSISLAASTTRRNSLLPQASRGGHTRDALPPDLRATLTDAESGHGKMTRAEIARSTKQALTGVSQRRIL
mmetsp:Transcript_5074/g.9557  ORF Transcript_5074/g.9557 Transcript_5074/m.9557 type:complete len:449 (-) Transcript_5074:68-1414(-)